MQGDRIRPPMSARIENAATTTAITTAERPTIRVPGGVDSRVHGIHLMAWTMLPGFS